MWLSKPADFDLGWVVETMSNSLQHRGPDAGGVWVDNVVGLALGHRRLSIVDLSPSGSQPMASSCGRFMIVFNGEVYNHRDIRASLESVKGPIAWRGHSDTEVMLEAIAHWGLESALSQFVGMFAFAIWDRYEKVLSLVRDRLGEKPLYFGNINSHFVFASELKAFYSVPGWNGAINREEVARYLDRGYVAAPKSIFEGVYKVSPGTIVQVKQDHLGRHDWVVLEYWSPNAIAERAVANPFQGNFDQAAETLEHLMRQSIKQQLAADVPVGAFLSGGVDSSTVVAIMQSESAHPVNTFTIGLSESNLNEALEASRIAAFLGTTHHEHIIHSNELLSVLPKISKIHDEPFSDSSQVPTYLVSEFARRSVTVSLSGDGGDELFGGYQHYFRCRDIWQIARCFPLAMRRHAAYGLRQMLELSRVGIPAHLGDRLSKLLVATESASMKHLHRYLMSQSKFEYRPLGDEFSALVPEQMDSLSQLMYADLVEYLPDDILVKVDRASMAVSLESRVPLLDHRIVEFALSLPVHMKIRHKQGKCVLRAVQKKYFPNELIHAGKKGFSVPVDDWLRGPLRDWAEELLESKKMLSDGFLDVGSVRRMWNEHLKGHNDWQHGIWTVLMFQSWLNDYRSRVVTA